MNPLDQLSLVWQVWGAMLLGAVLLMLGLFIGIEWRWICASTRSTWTAAVACARALFTDPRPMDPSPQTAETIARAKAVQDRERRACGIDEDGHPLRRRGRAAIARAHADDALRRRQLLALAESSPFRKTVN